MLILRKPLPVKSWLTRLFGSLVVPCLVIFSPYAVGGEDVQYYVSPTGNDSHPGTKTRPFLTIQKGIDVHRNGKELKAGARKTLWLMGGVYELNKPIVLGKKDSELKISAVDRDNPPRLIGGRIVKGFTPLKQDQMRFKLPESVRSQVLVADLKKLNITDYGIQKAYGFGKGGTSPMELFVDGRRATLARYPNVGWLAIASLPGGKEGKSITANLGAQRLQRWKLESEPWLYGYWFHGWADRFLPVKAVDVVDKTLTMDQLHHYGLRKGQRFFAQNLLCELDSPGEYYIDRSGGKIYLYPPEGSDFEAIVSTLEVPIIQIREAHGIHLEGLSIEAGRSSGVLVSGCLAVDVISCRVSNTGETGVKVVGGKACAVVNCEVFATGSSGVVISGGDRKTLTAAGHRATNNHIHHVSRLRRTYTPAIAVNGVGNRVSRNHLHHAPHQAISFGGNNHLIELNEIHHVVLETDDSGAIYTCPRDYTSRGTMIRHNYIHHSGPHHASKVPDALRTEKNVVYEPMHIHGTSLIYLDDLTGGMKVEGNVLEGAHRAMLIGGGRDNTISGNLILGGNIGIWIDGRGLGWAAKYVSKGGSHGFFRKYEEMKGNKPPYIRRYPGLATALTDHPAAPVNTVAHSNVVLGAKIWKKTDGKSDPFIKFERNYHAPAPKLPADATPENALMTVDPATLRKLGFRAIPFAKIGRLETAK